MSASTCNSIRRVAVAIEPETTDEDVDWSEQILYEEHDMGQGPQTNLSRLSREYTCLILKCNSFSCLKINVVDALLSENVKDRNGSILPRILQVMN